MSRREQGLDVEIIDGALSISIGVDALVVAARGGDSWTDGDEVTSVEGFADEIASALRDEEEDGTTLVHLALDSAIERALEAGSLNIRYACEDE